MTERIEASRAIPAGPEEIFAVLRDPDDHVAIDATGMLQSSTGGPVSAVDESFVIHMDRESLGDYPMGHYDVEVVFTRYDPPHVIEWTIIGTIKPQIGHVWGYELAAADGGTLVTSYCDWSNAAPEWKGIFPVIDQKSIRATLGILERAVVRGYPKGSRESGSWPARS